MFQRFHRSFFLGDAGRGVCLALMIAALSGCVANSSNPVISAQAAEMNAIGARITLNLANPGGVFHLYPD